MELARILAAPPDLLICSRPWAPCVGSPRRQPSRRSRAAPSRFSACRPAAVRSRCGAPDGALATSPEDDVPPTRSTYHPVPTCRSWSTRVIPPRRGSNGRDSRRAGPTSRVTSTTPPAPGASPHRASTPPGRPPRSPSRRRATSPTWWRWPAPPLMPSRASPLRPVRRCRGGSADRPGRPCRSRCLRGPRLREAAGPLGWDRRRDPGTGAGSVPPGATLQHHVLTAVGVDAEHRHLRAADHEVDVDLTRVDGVNRAVVHALG